uniref:Serine/threonine-protein phosphatase 2A regulatory subunit B'' subunit beta n=1 Tax=Ascaris suum TaxID=6253 RepID=F1KTT6_ASCSU
MLLSNTMTDYQQRRLAALLITQESLADFRQRLGYASPCKVQSDQSSTATRVVHPLDLSGVQEGDLEVTGATTELQHLSDTPTGARLIPIDGERVAVSPSLPPISPRTPGRQHAQISRILSFSPRSPRLVGCSGSTSPQRSGTPERGMLSFRLHPQNETMVETLRLSFNADESFPTMLLSENVFCDESVDNAPTEAEVTSSVGQLCGMLEKLQIASDGVSVTESGKPEERTPIKKETDTTIELFYYPAGKPVSSEENNEALRKAGEIFERNGNKVTFEQMADVCHALSIPVYSKRPIFNNCVCNPHDESLKFDDLEIFWKRMTAVAHDEAARFVFSLTNGSRSYAEFADFAPLVMDIVETHPSLDFLKADPRFHKAYVETVTCRIFWAVNCSWSGRITAAELRRSNFLEELRKLETADDVNDELDYFSYEHFYVVYCKFQELSSGRDCLTSDDLAQYSDRALPDLVVSRIFTEAVSRGPHNEESVAKRAIITYVDFVYFLLAEVDKSHPSSMKYWFRVMDLDEDGCLSLHEMKQFFDAIVEKMTAASVDAMCFNDVICLLFDAIRPRSSTFITLSDIKRSQMSTYFFNNFINWLRYFLQETSEGNERVGSKSELSDWNLFCEREHQFLTAENSDDDDDFDENYNDNTHDVAFECARFLTDDEDPSPE